MGSSIRLAYSTKPSIVIRKVPAAEGAVLEHAQVDDGCSAVNSRITMRDQTEDAQRRPEADLVAAEPVLALAGVEHHLQHAEAEREKSDAPQVDAAGAALADVVRVDDERLIISSEKMPTGTLM